MIKNNKIFTWISVALILITGGYNLFGYFHLPDVIATQFSTGGGDVNHMSTPFYLITTLLLVALLSVLCITKEQQEKLKYLLANIIIVIANIVMISIQL